MSRISISIAHQQLTLYPDDGDPQIFTVSTAKNGAGQEAGSFRTPLGRHIIRAKIGQGQPLNAVFTGRRPTGEIFTPAMLEEFPGRDWILTRILWLSGTQPGFNRLGDVDTMRRYIYIHGTPYETELGCPVSHGCVRMANRDAMDLFSRVTPGCPVEITRD